MHPEEAAELSYANLAGSVPLFNELHDRLGDSGVDQSVLAAMLQEITGAEMENVMYRVALIERIFGGSTRVFGAVPPTLKYLR